MKVVLVGAGDYGQVYLSYLQEEGAFEVVSILDDNPDLTGRLISGIPVLGTTADLLKCKNEGIEGVIAPIGDNKSRVRILNYAKNQGLMTPNYIHNRSNVSRDALIGNGVYILPGSTIMPFATLHDYVMISMGVNLAHHTVLHQGAFLSTGVNIGANIEVGECVMVGIGAVVMTGVRSIGSFAVVGAGAVVIRDVAPETTVVGVPARPLHID